MTYQEYVARLRSRHREAFSETDLAPQFREYFGQRIEVTHPVWGTRRGWVSGTTGWRPSLMLLKLRTSSGSSDLLTEEDQLIRVINRGPR